MGRAWGEREGPAGPFLTLCGTEALDQGSRQGLVGDLAGVDSMACVLGTGQRQGAAEAVGAVLAIQLGGTGLDALGVDNTVHRPPDTDGPGVEAAQQAHHRGTAGLELLRGRWEDEDGGLSHSP